MKSDLFYKHKCTCGSHSEFERVKKVIMPHGIDYICKCKTCEKLFIVVYSRGGSL